MNGKTGVWSNAGEQKQLNMNQDAQNPPNDEAPPKDQGRRFETLTEALEAGKNDGAAKAREKGPAFKSGIADAAHDLAYGLAFGSVFTGTFVHELIPRSLRDGFSRGAAAGKAAARDACKKVNNSFKTENEEVGTEESTKPSFS